MRNILLVLTGFIFSCLLLSSTLAKQMPDNPDVLKDKNTSAEIDNSSTASSRQEVIKMDRHKFVKMVMESNERINIQFLEWQISQQASKVQSQYLNLNLNTVISIT